MGGKFEPQQSAWIWASPGGRRLRTRSVVLVAHG